MDEWKGQFVVVHLDTWLLTVTAFGIGINYMLARWLLKNLTVSAQSIWTGIAAALGTHAVIVSAIIGIAKWKWEVPRNELEQIGYFVCPFVFAILAVPSGILACWRRSTKSE